MSILQRLYVRTCIAFMCVVHVRDTRIRECKRPFTMCHCSSNIY